MKTKILPTIICLGCILFNVIPSFGQTSWTGITSTNWATVTNWTAGVPLSTTDAIIGDASFTGAFQPAISATATAKTLTIGNSLTSQLTVNSTLTVRGDININSNGTLINASASISLTGNWNNSGSYTTTSVNSTVTFNGTVQSLGGSVLTTFRKLTIYTGTTVTLTSNVICAGTSSVLSVSGTLNPGESPSYLVTSDSLIVNNGGILKVNAHLFTSNYTITKPISLVAGSIVHYSATAIDQVVSSSHTYSTIRISGAGRIKSLASDLPLLRSTSSSVGNIYVLSGTLDLSTFLANRGTIVAGGTLSVSNGAFLKAGGTNSFPASYLTNTLSLTSTVEYNGTNQAISAKTYGNLVLSSSGGAAIKTMPATAFTISGSFTSNIGVGTSVSYTAASNISITGSVNIGASTTFNGATFSHSITGSFNNNGIFAPATSTITLRGAGSVISGNAVQDFYNLTITASNVTAPTITAINIAGNLATSGSGAFTQPSPGILTMTGTTKTITGSNIILYDLSVTGVVTTTTTANVKGNITVTGSLIASSGTITMSGATKVITNSGTLSFRALLISGTVTTASNFSISYLLSNVGTFLATTGTVTFTGSSSVSGTVNLFNVTINGTSLTPASNSVLGIANVFSITAGSLRVTSYLPNTVNYNGTGAQTIRATSYNNLILSNGNTKTAGGNITVNNVLTMASATTFSAVNFTISIYGNWINNGTFTAGTSTVLLRGATNTSISGASTFNILNISKTLSSYAVTLLNNISVATATMTLGTLMTGSNTITITTSRSGNGIILGTITRTHAFVAAVAYAFEGPNNIITFAAGVSGVSSVTVTVTVGSVADFPFGGAMGRYYNITVPSGTYNATLRLHYEDAELNGNDETIMQLWKYNGASWAVSGKTLNSSSSNFVEKSGLTNITERWSMTDDGRVLSWNGTVSSDWSTDANWTLIQGVSTSAPTLTDIAQIGIVAFTNQPIISTSATVKSLSFGSAQAVTLTLNTGGALTAYGNISGTWGAGRVHTINANTQTLMVNGDLALSDNVSGHTIDLNLSTGTVNVLGSVTQSGGANITFTNAGTLNIGKHFIYSAGVFSAGTGLVKYNGNVSQIVAGVAYNNLTVIKTGATVATLTEAASITGNLILTTGELELKNSLTVSGSVTINSGAILDADAVLLNVGGSWTKATTGIFNAGTGTVNFNGSGTQTISEGTYNNLSFDKLSGTAILSGNDTVNGNLSLLSGTLNLSTFTLNKSSAGDIFTIADGTTLLVAGTNNFPANFINYNIGTNSLVHYNGTVAQSVGDVTYGNITFSNGGAMEKIFLGSSTINGDMIINSGATLNGGSFVITLNGNWINNSGIFIAGTGDILLNGISKTLTGNTTFYDVTVSGSYSVATSDITFNGLLLVTSTGSYTAGIGVGTVNGDLTNSGSLSSSGTVTFSGTSLQTIRLINAISSTSTGIVNFNGNVSPVLNSTSTPVFATLNISNTAGIDPSVGWYVAVACNISNGAIFNGGVSSHTFARTFTNNGTVTSSGTLNFTPAAAVTLQLAGTSFSSTGTVIFGGSGAVTLSGTPTALQDVIISNTNVAGITAAGAWTINGKLSVNSSAIFNAGSFSHLVAGDIESNGILNGNTSTFTMSSATGQLSGSPGTVFHNLTITGFVTSNSDYNVDGDFMNNGSYDGSLGALIMVGSNPSVVGGTTTPSAIAQLTISKTGGAVVTSGVNINSLTALLINSGTFFTSTYNLFQDAAGGALIVFPGATLKLGGINTLPAFSGYGLDEQSTVDYAGTAQAISNGPVYGNLTISTAGNKTTPSFLPLTIAGNFTITAGTFIANNNTHKIAGNWIMTGGTFTNANSVIRFNGSVDQNIQTIAPFNSVNISKASGVVTLLNDITVNAILSFTTGKIQTDNYSVILPSTGTLTGAAQGTGWVNGNLQKNVAVGNNISKGFEIGGTVNYTPATVLFASVTTSGNLKAGTVSLEHPQIDFSGLNPGLDVNRYWTLTNSGAVFTTATSTFNWAATDLDAGTTTASFNTALYNGASWVLPTFVSPLATSIQATGLASFGTFAIGERSRISTWTGAAGTNDWFTPANWYGGMPGINMETLIPASLQAGRVYPVVNTGVATVDTITIQNPATLTITNSTLQIKGAIINSGTFDVSDGTIELKGSTPQTIPANAFANNMILNLIINNNATLAGQCTLTGTLTIGSSNKTLASGGFLTLRSSAAFTAKVAPLPVDGTGNSTSFITGAVTVERFIPARRAWRLLTAPLSNTASIYNSWQNAGVYEPGKGIFITGPNPLPANGLDASLRNTGSIKSFNPVTQAFFTITDTKSTDISNSNGNADNAGYFVFVRGDRHPNNLDPVYSNSTTLSAAGNLQTGKQTFAASGTYGNYTIMGNPYASPVDFDKIQRTHLIKRFYAWDATLNIIGAYVVLDDIDGDGTFSRSNPSSLQDKNIQSGQAFFVQTDTAGTASLIYYESSKSNAVRNAGFRPLGQTISMEITLKLVESDNSTITADAAIAEFNDNFCSCVNLQDAVKFTNTNETMSLLRNGTSLAIERRPLINKKDTLFLRLIQSTQRNYQLVFNTNNLAQPNLQAFLEDKYTGIATPVNINGSTVVNFTINGAIASINKDRFRVVFKETEILPVTYSDVKAWQQGDDIAVRWHVENQLNIQRYEVEKSIDGRNFSKVNSQPVKEPNAGSAIYNWVDLHAVEGDNFYRIPNIDLDGTVAYSKVVKVNIGKGPGGMTVHPNPVTDGVIGLQLNNLAKGEYAIRLLNTLGQVMMVKDIRHAGGSSTEKITLQKNIAKGIYNLEVTDPGMSKTIIRLVNQ